MPKRTTLCTLAASLTAIATLAVLAALTYKAEPVYEGHPLHYWVGISPGGGAQDRYEAEHALREIGTNAVPFLLRWLQRKPQPWRFKIAAPVRSHVSRRLADWIVSTERIDAPLLAAKALMTLGPEAAAAVPELTKLMNDRRAPETAATALEIMTTIGGAAVPALVSAIEDPRFPDRAEVIRAFRRMPPPPATLPLVAPTLIRCLANTNEPALQPRAAETLGCLKAAPELAVPALTNYLKVCDPGARLVAIRAIADYGTLGRSAAPALQALLSAPEGWLRTEATNALLQIAPEALTNGHPTR